MDFSGTKENKTNKKMETLTGRRMADGGVEPELCVPRFRLRLSINKVEELRSREFVGLIDEDGAGIFHQHR